MIDARQAFAELEQESRETPLGEQIDAGAEEYMAQFDNDPNPYEGTYSEE